MQLMEGAWSRFHDTEIIPLAFFSWLFFNQASGNITILGVVILIDSALYVV
jgi:hypothetical protein